MDKILDILETLIQDIESNMEYKKLLKPCPKCGVKPKSVKDTVFIFGYRQMEKNDPHSIIRQSYCKKCR